MKQMKQMNKLIILILWLKDNCSPTVTSPVSTKLPEGKLLAIASGSEITVLLEELPEPPQADNTETNTNNKVNNVKRFNIINSLID